MTNPKEVLEHYRSERETKVHNMEAGRELDALVAEKVFKWKAWKEIQGDITFINFQKPEECEPYKKYRNWENEMGRFQKIRFSEIDYFNHIVMKIPEYSTDISAAWEVVEKVRPKFDLVHITDTGLGWSFVLEKFNDNGFPVDSNQFEYTSESLPQAICKAALLAIWEDKK